MVNIVGEDSLNKEILRVIEGQQEKVAAIVRDCIKLAFEGTIGKSSKITQDIKYRIEKDKIIIYSDNPVPKFIDEGTQPHKIKAKPGKKLAFRNTSGTVKSKSGRVINFGDWVFVDEVNHPGFEARPYIELALFQARHRLKKELFN